MEKKKPVLGLSRMRLHSTSGPRVCRRFSQRAQQYKPPDSATQAHSNCCFFKAERSRKQQLQHPCEWPWKHTWLGP